MLFCRGITFRVFFSEKIAEIDMTLLGYSMNYQYWQFPISQVALILICEFFISR